VSEERLGSRPSQRIVIIAWLLAALVLSVAAGRLGERMTDDLTLPGTGSTKAAQELARTLPAQQYGSVPIDLHGKLTDDAIAAATKSLQAAPHVTGVGTPQVNKDTAALPVTLDAGPGDLTKDKAQQILDAAEQPGLQTAAGGYVGSALSKPSTHLSGVVGLAAAVLILALASLAVAGIPLVTTLGYVAALAVIVAVLAATTLLPALLHAQGTRVEAPLREERSENWARWAQGVAAHPLDLAARRRRDPARARAPAQAHPSRADRRRQAARERDRAPGVRPDPTASRVWSRSSAS